ncbi:MAG: TcpQ domain-containing protein [Pseudomonadota bacterium]
MRKTTVSSGRSLIAQACATFLAILSPVVHAGYTVIDDDLYPTTMLEARNARPNQQVAEPDHLSLGFSQFRAILGPLGRGILDAQMSVLRNASQIRIVGRPDAMPAASADKSTSIAQARAISIRNYLIKQGVDEHLIWVEVDNSPNPQKNGINYPSDIFVTRGGTRSASIAAPVARSVAQDFIPQQPQLLSRAAYQEPPHQTARPEFAPVAAPQAAPTNSNDAALIQYINQSVQSGQMQPAVAVQLIRSLLASTGGTRAVESPTRYPVQTAAYSSNSPAPDQVRVQAIPERWVLDKQMSLRANLDAWSSAAGWNSTVWEANNAYQVTNTVAVDGAFPEVLRRVADATGLNICANPRQRFVRVTESSIPCDKK